MSLNKKILYGDNHFQTINENETQQPVDINGFRFDSTEITFDSTLKTFDNNQ